MKDNEKLKEKVKSKVDALVKKKLEESKKMKEQIEVDTEKTQAPVVESPKDEAPQKPEGATQDDMKVKYEEASEEDENTKKEASEEDENTKKESSEEDENTKKEATEEDENTKKEATEEDDSTKKEELNLDDEKTQAKPTESPQDKATSDPDGAPQDDMKVKYEEGADEEDDSAIQENTDSDETKKENADPNKSDMDKVVEILEALKSQVDSNTKKLEEMTKGDDKEMPEAPLSERFHKAVDMRGTPKKEKLSLKELF